MDKLKELGPGITSYHRLLLSLMLLFLILFVTHLPVLSIFSQYKFYDQDVGFIIKRSIGNMGFSMTNCESTLLMNSHQQKLECKSGRIADLVSWGFLTETESQDQCLRNDNSFCNKVLNDKKFDDFY